MIIGIVLVIIASFVSSYLIELDTIKDSYNFIVPYEFVVNVVVFISVFMIYNIIQKIKIKSIFKDLETLQTEINNFLSTKTFNSIEAKTKEFFPLFVAINKLFTKIIEDKEHTEKKLTTLESDNKEYNNILNLENVVVMKVTESGKVIKANNKFFKLLNVKNVSKFNMQVKHIFDIFENKLDKDFVTYLEEDIKVTINDTKFIMHIEKVQKEMSYVITLIDITNFENEKEEIIKKTQYVSENLKTIFAINKSQETLMIKILNYDNYATYLGSGIMEVFEAKFVATIKSMGYEDIFKVQNNIFAVYDFSVDFDKYKRLLEENIVITVGKDKYIFNPKVVLASGVNFEQAYQQILESSKTLISKPKEASAYNLEIIKLINKTILSNNIKLGYKSILNHNDTILIYPVIVDEYGNIIPQDEVENIVKEFNLYLSMLKQIIINHINILKNYKIIVNVSSEDLFSLTILSDLLSLIKREELMIVFNISINSNYSLVSPLLRQIKSYAQIGIRNVGHGYISFKDIYNLKVGYLEVDDNVVKLIKEDKKWSFLLDSIKLLVSGQNTKLLSNNYSDDKVYQISKDLKIYN